MSNRINVSRRGKDYRSRRTDFRHERQSFLVVCEGVTERLYFDRFRIKEGVRIKPEDRGEDPLKLVEYALERKKRSRQQFDQVWCVFDRDDVPAQQFNDALALAQENRFHVAYSNPCFELWYLLHFEFYHTSVARALCTQKLTTALGHTYHKADESIYDKLRPFQQEAIENAQRLWQQYAGHRPEADNPSTTVHELVLELLRSARPRG